MEIVGYEVVEARIPESKDSGSVKEDFRAEFYYTEKYDMIYEKEKPIIHFHFFSLYGNMGSFEFFATDIESVERIQTNTFRVELNKRYKYDDVFEQEQEQEEQETTKAESTENTWRRIFRKS